MSKDKKDPGDITIKAKCDKCGKDMIIIGGNYDIKKRIIEIIVKSCEKCE